jgi:putative ABC transport system permease protein
VLVSAVLAPEDRLWERAQKLGGNLPAAEFEKYSCRAYPLLVARDLASAIPGSEGRAMLRSSEAEGKIVEGMRWVTVFVAGGVLLASALAVFAALATSIIERRREIALWKSIGASRAQVILPFLAETGATGLLGGVFGIALGGLLAARIGATVFGRPAGVSPLLMGPAIVVALLLALAGAWLPLSFALRLDPAEILKGD